MYYVYGPFHTKEEKDLMQGYKWVIYFEQKIIFGSDLHLVS